MAYISLPEALSDGIMTMRYRRVGERLQVGETSEFAIDAHGNVVVVDGERFPVESNR